MKSELAVPPATPGNLIQGSYGMGMGVDKLKQFSETHSHLIQKHAPGYINSGRYEPPGSSFLLSKFEQMSVSGANYSLALVNFIMCFKKANDVVLLDAVEDSLASASSEDSRDTLEFMAMFQEYVKIG